MESGVTYICEKLFQKFIIWLYWNQRSEDSVFAKLTIAILAIAGPECILSGFQCFYCSALIASCETQLGFPIVQLQKH